MEEVGHWAFAFEGYMRSRIPPRSGFLSMWYQHLLNVLLKPSRSIQAQETKQQCRETMRKKIGLSSTKLFFHSDEILPAH